MVELIDQHRRIALRQQVDRRIHQRHEMLHDIAVIVLDRVGEKIGPEFAAVLALKVDR